MKADFDSLFAYISRSINAFSDGPEGCRFFRKADHLKNKPPFVGPAANAASYGV